MSKPRVFISSVIEGFEVFRAAAKTAITAVNGEPVLVNEDFPSKSQSSRNACLDGVDSCDILVLVQGARGGWRTPSGKLVVEEELEHARRRCLRCLAFIQQGVEQDADAKQFVKKIEDYIDGYFRAKFMDPEELRSAIERALQEPIAMTEVPLMNSQSIQAFLSKVEPVIDGEASIRFVLSPERDEEVLNPLLLATADFADRIIEIGHASSVKLLSYRFAMAAPEINEVGHLILSQDGGSNWREGQQAVRIEISEKGLHIIDLNVTGRRHHEERSFTFGGILESDIREGMSACFRFAASIFKEIDPYKRHDVFVWNSALVGSEHRRILKTVDDPAANRPNIYGEKKPIAALEEGRSISRATLSGPSDEVALAVLRWSQRLAVPRH